ncbi:MAG: helix-turn-helix domain-containing protein [Bacillota bacterium]
MTTSEEDLRTIDHRKAAELLGLHPVTVLRLARENRIPHLRLGRKVRFRVAALLAWMEEQEREHHTRAA